MLRLIRVGRVIRLFKEGPIKDINRIIMAVSTAAYPVRNAVVIPAERRNQSR